MTMPPDAASPPPAGAPPQRAPLPPYVPPPWPELSGGRLVALRRLVFACFACGLMSVLLGVVITVSRPEGSFFVLVGAVVAAASWRVWRRPTRARALRAAWLQVAGLFFALFVLMAIVIRTAEDAHPACMPMPPETTAPAPVPPPAPVPCSEDPTAADEALSLAATLVVTAATIAFFSGPIQLIAFMVLYRAERRHLARGGALPPAVARPPA